MSAAASSAIRTAEERDLPALQALCADALIHDPLDASELPVQLWQSPTTVADLRLVAVQGTAVVGCLLGSIQAAEEGPTRGHLDLLAVDSREQGRGIGRRLLAEAESRIRELGIEELRVGNHGYCYAWPGVDVRYTPALCFLEDRGYEAAVGPHMNMTVRLDSRDWDASDAERELAKTGVAVSRLHSDDRDEFLGWMEQHWGAAWAWEAGESFLREPISGHVARQDGQIVSFACHGTNRSSWFGPTGTLPEARGRGIATVLLLRCLGDQHRAGLPWSEIAWIGPVRFYSRGAGAYLDRAFLTLSKTLA